jgi:hypothetical protein
VRQKGREEEHRKRIIHCVVGPSLHVEAMPYIAGRSQRFQILTAFSMNRFHILDGLRSS